MTGMLLRRSRLNHAVADEQQRTLGVGDQLRRRVHRRRIDVGHAMIHVALEVELDVPVRDDARLLRVLRDVDQDRSWTARPSQIKRLGDDARDVARVAHEVAVFRDRHGDADDVRLLEGVGP